MKIEFSFMTGIFDEYEICTNADYGRIVELPHVAWCIYVYNKEGILNLACPGNIFRCRYQGVVFETLHDKDQLAMLRRKLEEDFAVERLD